ncbi:RidA family protein [Patescibacteria group bacterium]
MSVPYSPYKIAGNLIFLAGHIHTNEEGKLVGQSIEEKTHQVMKNIGKTLKKAGSSFTDVTKTTIYLTDLNDYVAVNEVYVQYFKAPYPAREAVEVSKLPLGASVEISLIATK